MEKWLPVISGGLTEFNSPLNDTVWQESSEIGTEIFNVSLFPRQVARYELKSDLDQRWDVVTRNRAA
jgi:hypothetical protein